MNKSTNYPLWGLGDFVFVKQTLSTNALLQEMIRKDSLPEGFVVQTDFQTAGKGQIGNSWESEAGKNLLFSMVLYPNQIRLDEQFLISQFVSLAIKRTLDQYLDGITIKWPNDIYWNNRKIAGILIENVWQGMKIKSSVIGIGLNVNQLVFTSDAPNPVSMIQITGKRFSRVKILNEIVSKILDVYENHDIPTLRKEYMESLFRNVGFYPYKTDQETFNAKIVNVRPDGKLELETQSGELKSFYFKEVQFI
jgi:BirA family biotin operon repressor/biotin-[acetyl-CoA-carboxylase] ligase